MKFKWGEKVIYETPKEINLKDIKTNLKTINTKNKKIKLETYNKEYNTGKIIFFILLGIFFILVLIILIIGINNKEDKVIKDLNNIKLSRYEKIIDGKVVCIDDRNNVTITKNNDLFYNVDCPNT